MEVEGIILRSIPCEAFDGNWERKFEFEFFYVI